MDGDTSSNNLSLLDEEKGDDSPLVIAEPEFEVSAVAVLT